MSPQETYAQWRQTLKRPDDSLFYYHKSLDRILLGLAIFVISTKRLLPKLGKAESLGILHLQVPELITYWIDGNGEGFETLFPMVMTICEAFPMTANAMGRQYPSSQRAIRTLACQLCHASGIGGDMKQQLADGLLDDLETDGREIYSDKIKAFGERLMFLTQRYGLDIPYHELTRLGGW